MLSANKLQHLQQIVGMAAASIAAGSRQLEQQNMQQGNTCQWVQTRHMEPASIVTSHQTGSVCENFFVVVVITTSCF